MKDITFTIIQATNVPKMDTLSKSDPYIKFTWNNKKYKTMVRDNDKNPYFNCTFSLPFNASSGPFKTTLNLFDYNKILPNEKIGEVSIDFREYKPYVKVPVRLRLINSYRSEEICYIDMSVQLNGEYSDENSFWKKLNSPIGNPYEFSANNNMANMNLSNHKYYENPNHIPLSPLNTNPYQNPSRPPFNPNYDFNFEGNNIEHFQNMSVQNEYHKQRFNEHHNPDQYLQQYPNKHSNNYPNQHSNPYPNKNSNPYPNQYSNNNPHPNQYPNPYPNQYTNPHPNQYTNPHPNQFLEQRPNQYSNPNPNQNLNYMNHNPYTGDHSAALYQFSQMFPNIPQQKIIKVLKKCSFNHEKVVQKLLKKSSKYK